jgi:hypothetical protein
LIQNKGFIPLDEKFLNMMGEKLIAPRQTPLKKSCLANMVIARASKREVITQAFF